MIKIKPMPPQIDKGQLDALSLIETTDIGHFRFWGAMDPKIRPVIPGLRIAGTAVTLILPAMDSALLPYVLGLVRPGDVLVIDRQGDRDRSCLGGTIATAAKAAGVAGIVVDGVATDFDEIRHENMPVWCRGVGTLATKLLALAGAINVPISCGGVAVNPGDAIVADDGGIFVLMPEDIEGALASRRTGGGDRKAQLRAGRPLAELNGVKALVDAAIARRDGR